MTLISFNQAPASFVALEVVILTWAALTLRHALRSGQLFTWLTILVYGLAMEIVSYNAVDNFAHGQFTVMFYDHQLPLYVTAVYPVLLYTGITLARSLNLHPAAEAVAAGLFIVALDVPFDMLGPRLGWWRWFDTDPNIAYRWAGVPVTSYFWHLSFGGALAAITALAARRRRPPLWMVPVCAVATMVVGVLLFLPFHGLAAAGVSHGAIVAGALATAAVITAVAWVRRGAPEAL